MLKSKFENLLVLLEEKKVLITTHNFVDIDGFASCIVLKYLLNQLLKDKEVYIFFPELTKQTKEYFNKFKEKFSNIQLSLEEDINFEQIELMLIIDTNNLDQLDFNESFNIYEAEIPFIFIDHHFYIDKEYKGNERTLNIISDDYTSAAEIVYELTEAFNIVLPIPYKFLLLSGILTDSGFFKYGSNETIMHASKLIEPDYSFQDILIMLKIEEDLPEKIAKIKGLQRAKLIRENNWLIGVTHVSSYEASVAISLIKAGYDVAIVLAEKKGEYRISTRAKKKICIERNLHLGKILEEVSELFEGSGGGHDGAAAMNGNNYSEEIIELILEKVKETLNN